jgi:hypothetical protein
MIGSSRAQPTVGTRAAQALEAHREALRLARDEDPDVILLDYFLPDATGRRRAFIRFFACGDDLSHERTDAPLPEAVASGRGAFCVVGAIAGG